MTDACDLEPLVLRAGEARLEVLPEKGGTVVSLRLPWGGKQLPLLAGYPNVEEWEANPQYRGSFLLPWPNRVREGHYIFRGQAHQLPINERTRNNALHGFFSGLPMAVLGLEQETNAAVLRLGCAYEGEHLGYPFPFRVQLEYRLDPVGFACSVEVTAGGMGPLPLGFGWHPYFTLGVPVDCLRLCVPAARQALTDARMIPTGDTTTALDCRMGRDLAGVELDTLFLLDAKEGLAVSSLEDPERALRVEVWQEAGSGKLPFLCAYTPEDRESIALEPMSCAIDAFNSGDGLITLAPGETWSASFGVRLAAVNKESHR